MNQFLHENSFLNSENALYIAEQFKRFINAPTSVSDTWQNFFQQLNDNERSVLLDLTRGSKYIKSKKPAPSQTTNSLDVKEIELSLKASNIADAYRRWGHYAAQLDPLNLTPPKNHPGLNTKAHTLTDTDLDIPLKGFKIGRRDTLRGIIEQLSKVYCGNAAYEYMHIPNMEEVNWIKRRLETAPFALTEDDEVEIFEWLVKTELFEHFLAKKFPGAKRFGIEGCDALIPMLHDILTRAAADELGNAVIGMAHRGRLNTLYNVIGRPYEEALAKFMNQNPNHTGLGDVKYHVGGSVDVILHDKPLHVSLLYNPSHLEAINPVVMGNVWAKQQDNAPNTLGILVHGDAAFAGQGVNAETFLMSQAPGYSVGGMIHIITNNQVGFTANPTELRSTDYASDLAKSINAPIFHVNADNIEACIFVTWLAYSYRQEFKKDVVIDLIGYRRYGHNEGDEPGFTQPVMYSKIKTHPSLLTQYEQTLIAKNTLTSEKAQHIRTEYEAALIKAYDRVSTSGWPFNNYTSHTGRWEKIHPNNDTTNPSTGVRMDILKEIGIHISTPPQDFNINSKIARQLNARKHMIETGTNLDWATGELLAYGSLLTEGIPVRISGEDCIRGTFSHRHVGLYDQTTNALVFPINKVPHAKSTLCAYNSVLSEYGVMGFDYGAALSNPNRLVVWEAQFGDFANGAQILIDQFIASAETKWDLYNGLVLLLPHGLEGQGPEHSSARLERFLQLCAEDNIRVINPTTPANMFHALRRQIHSPNRKPLIVMTPKSLLRHKLAVSSLNDMAEKTHFKPVIEDANITSKASKIILCSGKIYYDLFEQRAPDANTALIRIEQLYPFPSDELKTIFNKNPNAQIVWCQEEPQNMGAWTHVYFNLKDIGITPEYIGRPPAASPATGYTAVHQAEQSAIINAALNVKRT
ncbi:MAG: 2-oxoglutarate dehydrogenase E1 component [Candidatus Paracaedibacteraceae bacterium]|nr:2-oxoglutarate dehydrogenase E1 component [Candidatus Paracaedibacteraceae bacterium]